MEATGRFGKQRWLKIVWVRLPDKQINAKTFKVISIAAATKKAKKFQNSPVARSSEWGCSKLVHFVYMPPAKNNQMKV